MMSSDPPGAISEIACSAATPSTRRSKSKSARSVAGGIGHLDGAAVGHDGDRRLDAQEHLRQQALDCCLLLACLQAFGDVAAQDDAAERIAVAHRHQVQAEPERGAALPGAEHL